MDTIETRPDLSLQLPRDLYYHALHSLRTTMPAPVSDRPEDLVRRDNAAIADIASLLPANAEEVEIAVQFVSANAQAKECCRLMHLHTATNIHTAMQCNAQSANMMRQARGARALLLRVQAARHKREADDTALEKAAWIEHSAIGLMADALADPPPPPPPPSRPGNDLPDTPAVEAVRYAFVHPDRAALLRFLGGLPKAALPGFDPAIHAPDPAVVDVIVNDQTLCTLTDLLEPPRRRPPAAR